jgi:molybdopterin-guanine dinucleotide biosynthesis protein A
VAPDIIRVPVIKLVPGSIVSCCWLLKESINIVAKLPFSAVVLAGGDSKRMGTNKAFLRLEGNNLIDLVFNKVNSLFAETIVVTDRIEELAYLPAKLTRDLFVGVEKNALRGIHAGLAVSSYPASFVIGCDMPFFSLTLIKYMSRFAIQYDVVVPRHGEFFQPLFAFYNKTTLGMILKQLKEKKLKISDLYRSLCIKEIGEDIIKDFDPHLISFNNINTRDDYYKLKKILNSKACL